MGIPEGVEKGKGTEELFQTIITANIPKLMSEVKSQIQETQIISSRKHPKQVQEVMTSSNGRKSKIKQKKNLKKELQKNKNLTYGRTKIRIIADFSETMQARRH